MPIYVDNMQLKCQVRGRYGAWSHLMAVPANEAELLTFASQIGLKHQWIQKAGTDEAHFDVNQTIRAIAISNGAIPVTCRQLMKLRQEATHG